MSRAFQTSLASGGVLFAIENPPNFARAVRAATAGAAGCRRRNRTKSGDILKYFLISRRGA
jgi:hypothetical protein